MYNTAFLDLDGTLTDSKPGIVNAIKYALEKLNVPMPDADRLNKFIGPPLMDSFCAECHMDRESAGAALGYYREYYSEKGAFENSVYDGVKEMLEELKANGIELVLATSKPEIFSVRILARFGLDKYFDHVAASTLDESRADKESVIRYGLEIADEKDPARIVMIGDRYYDIEGAKTFGLDSIGVLYGFGEEEELRHHGASYIAASPAQVADIVLGR